MIDELVRAIRNNNIDTVNTYIQDHHDVLSQTDKDGLSPLHYACMLGKGDITRVLLGEGGLNPNCQTEHGTTPLHFAARNGRRDCVQLLIEFKATLNISDERKWAPLHYACFGGQLEAAEVLTNNKANLNMATDEGYTPLHLCCYKGYVKIAELLISHGANVALVDKQGNTPMCLLPIDLCADETTTTTTTRRSEAEEASTAEGKYEKKRKQPVSHRRGTTTTTTTTTASAAADKNDDNGSDSDAVGSSSSSSYAKGEEAVKEESRKSSAAGTDEKRKRDRESSSSTTAVVAAAAAPPVAKKRVKKEEKGKDDDEWEIANNAECFSLIMSEDCPAKLKKKMIATNKALHDKWDWFLNTTNTGVCKEIIKKLRGKKDLYPELFEDPVTETIAPNYFTVIERPMDFRTLSDYLDTKKIYTLREFAICGRQIWQNCLTYNKGTNIFGFGEAFAEVFENSIMRAAWAPAKVTSEDIKSVKYKFQTFLQGLSNDTLWVIATKCGLDKESELDLTLNFEKIRKGFFAVPTRELVMADQSNSTDK